MYTATGSRITVAIGVLALSLAAISPAVTWAAEPVKQEKKAKQTGTGTHKRARPKSNRSKIRLGRDCRKSPTPVSVRRQRSTSSPPTKEKPETKSPSLEPTSARQPVYEASPSAQVTRLNFARPTTASQRPCRAVGKRAWFSSPSPPPREKTQDRFL